MGIEELKLILETVEGVSDSAVWVVVVFFGVGLVKNLVSGVCFGAFFYLIYRVTIIITGAVSLGGQVAIRLGEEDYNGYPSERVRLMAKLDRAIK